MSRLADIAGRVAAGDYHTRVPVPSPDDELARVTRSFNRMAAALEGTETTRRRLWPTSRTSCARRWRRWRATSRVSTTAWWPPNRRPGRRWPGALARLRRLVDDLGVVSRAEEHPPDLELQQIAPDELVAAAGAPGS